MDEVEGRAGFSDVMVRDFWRGFVAVGDLLRATASSVGSRNFFGRPWLARGTKLWSVISPRPKTFGKGSSSSANGSTNTGGPDFRFVDVDISDGSANLFGNGLDGNCFTSSDGSMNFLGNFLGGFGFPSSSKSSSSISRGYGSGADLGAGFFPPCREKL